MSSALLHMGRVMPLPISTLAVSGLPPSVFYRMGARVSDLIGRSVDLIDLDQQHAVHPLPTHGE